MLDETRQPVSIGRMRVGKHWRRIFYAMRTEGEGREAASIGAGLFIGCLPLFGLHLTLVVIIGKMLRLNRLQMYLAANISNPVAAPFLLLAELQTGALIRRDTLHHFTLESLRSLDLGTVVLDLAVGSVVIAAILGSAAAVVTQLVSRSSRRLNPVYAEIARDAAARYLNFSIGSWELARAKLGADPVYQLALLGNVLAPGASVLDVGCGRGLMLALLAEAKRFRLADSSASQDLPAPASLTGIELRKRVAAVAQRALGDDATIVTGDVRTGSMPRAGSILLFDVLHMVPFDEQASLLQRLIDVLEPSGVLLVREVDAAAGWRFTLVRVGNRLQAAVAGRWRQSLCFRSLDDWRRLLGELGLHATVVGSGQEGPFANVLIVARHGASPGLPVGSDAYEGIGGRA